MSNQIIAPNAGGPGQFPIRTPLAARIRQFGRYVLLWGEDVVQFRLWELLVFVSGVALVPIVFLTSSIGGYVGGVVEFEAAAARNQPRREQ